MSHFDENNTIIGEFYMQRAIKLASQGLGHTYPNPLVGSVIVCDDQIIGEGYHCKAGEPHAEVNAIRSVKDKLLLKKSTLYVNLEPCAHYGKTPPCSKLIIEMEVPKVVIGCVDSFSEVAGKGIEMMRAAGIDVEVSVLEKESRWLNRRFFTFHEKKRPYVILKWAQSADGFIDLPRNEEEAPRIKWITNDFARREVHKQRTHEQAILIGTNTALIDNPSLTVRDFYGHQPLRVVLDQRGRLPASLKLFDGSCPTLVFSAKSSTGTKNLEVVSVDFDDNLIPTILTHLAKRGLQSLIVEGGAELLQSFINAGFWDEAYVYSGAINFKNGVKAPVLDGLNISTSFFDDSSCAIYINKLLY